MNSIRYDKYLLTNFFFLKFILRTKNDSCQFEKWVLLFLDILHLPSHEYVISVLFLWIGVIWFKVKHTKVVVHTKLVCRTNLWWNWGCNLFDAKTWKIDILSYFFTSFHYLIAYNSAFTSSSWHSLFMSVFVCS